MKEQANENIIWKTEARLRNAWDIIENIELSLDDNGETTIRVIRSTEQEDDISIPRTLSVKEAIGLGVALIRSAGCIEEQ